MEVVPHPSLFAFLGAMLAVWGLGAVTPAAPRAVALTGGVGSVIAASAAVLYALLGLAVAGWREHPDEAGTVMVGGLALLATVVCLRYLIGGSDHIRSDEDDDDDGGIRPHGPMPPMGPDPSGTPGPTLPWEEFDAARSTWERPHAGAR